MDPVTSELMKNGEFAGRRAALMKQIKGGIAIFKGADHTDKNHNESAIFKQESNFYYLTGFQEPGAYFVLLPDAKKEKFIMFVKPRNLLVETWTGKHEGVEEAKSIYGADAAYPVDEFEKKLPSYLRGKEKIYCSFQDKDLMERVSGILKRGSKYSSVGIEDPRPLTGELRLIKSKGEIQLMQKAMDITGSGLKEVMRALTPGMTENKIDGLLRYMWLKESSLFPGFPPIVASGANASILHYTGGTRQMGKGELLLLDVGARYGNYTADISRTIPVSGKFTKKQAFIYNLVLKAQQKGIEAVAPGKGLKEVMDEAVNVMTDAMYDLGLITDKKSMWQKMIWFRYLRVSHWLGIDTHDVGDYKFGDKKRRILEPGMVFTMEPGIYIDASLLDKLVTLFSSRMQIKKEDLEAFVKKVKPIAQKYDGISVRIEDDILVTETGYKNLSANIPKTIKDIERLMKKTSPFNKL
jgi:Xaa-Pro aminopeptidase